MKTLSKKSYTVQECCEIFAREKRTIYYWLEYGILKVDSEYNGFGTRITRESILRHLDWLNREKDYAQNPERKT